MYRLLIADDEALEREGLELMITRAMPGVFELFHAENGRIAIELAERHRPDIILMDIKMPGIEGLEALRQIQERYVPAKMVMITAYDYFAYAKQALSLGVKEYLLKPAKREQVIGTLQRLIGELEAEQSKRRQELEQAERLSQVAPIAESELALSLLLDPVAADTDEGDLASLIGLNADRGCALMLSLPPEAGGPGGDAAGGEGVAAGDASHELRRRLHHAVKQFVKARYAGIVSPVVGRHLAVFLTAADDEGSEASVPLARAAVASLARSLAGFVESQLGLSVAVGVGRVHPGLAGLRRSCREALAAAAVQGSAAVRHYDDAPESPEPQAPGLGQGLESEVERLARERERETRSVMERTKCWIDERFRGDLSMEEAAEHAGLSPFYFSKVFKQHTGATFTDYLTHLRIEQAKALIDREALSLKEVCFEVGYRDPNYFSRVFKKVTGMSPSDYRQEGQPS